VPAGGQEAISYQLNAMLPPDYRLRPMRETDYSAIAEICARVYPADTPYTVAELAEHHHRFPEGQVVAEHVPTAAVAGVHFTLRLRFEDFHVDDSWDVLTDQGTFDDDDPSGHTLYGADIMVSPDHQHHSLAHALTDAARTIVVEESLWRMVGGSRLPGYGAVSQKMSASDYVEAVCAGTQVDPVLTVHIKDGWQVVRPIQGYLQHDPDSAGWAVVIQWVNPACPPPPGMELNQSASLATRP
jgi:ribosomal protein S18 acetylase RimI-like enzyme